MSESQTEIYSSPNKIFQIKVEQGPEFRMDAHQRTFVLPMAVSGISIFHTINGRALFLNDQYLIVEEQTLAILIDFVNKRAYHTNKHHSFVLDGDEVRVFSHEMPKIFRCKIEAIAHCFENDFPKSFDGRFPWAVNPNR